MNRRGGPVVEIDVKRFDTALKTRGLTQSGLAKMIGVTPGVVSRILSRGSCRQKLLADISDALWTSIENLVPARSTKVTAPEHWRQVAGLTREELAEKAGVGVQTLYRLEHEEGDILSFNAACLARACGVPMGVYLGYE